MSRLNSLLQIKEAVDVIFETAIALAHHCSVVGTAKEIREAITEAERRRIFSEARRLTLASQIASRYAQVCGGEPLGIHRAGLLQLCCDAQFYNVAELRELYQSRSPVTDYIKGSLGSGGFFFRHPFDQYQSKISGELWDDQYGQGDPWHALYLMISSRGSAEMTLRAYSRFVREQGTMQKARELFLLPAIAGCLCEGLISADGLNQLQQSETVRCLAMYVAMRLAFPRLSHAQVCDKSRLNIGTVTMAHGLISAMVVVRNDMFDGD